MKPLIAAVALLVLATPALASSAAEWDCGNGAKVISNRGELSFNTTLGSMYGEKGTYPRRGSHRPDWKWDFRGDRAKVWLNGKLCKQTN